MANKINLPKPPTPEEKRQQAMRIMAQKYESFFTGVLMGMVHNPAFDPTDEAQAKKLVQNAKTMADGAMNALYMPKEGQAAE